VVTPQRLGCHQIHWMQRHRIHRIHRLSKRRAILGAGTGDQWRWGIPLDFAVINGY
jgi:hypothetical protein